MKKIIKILVLFMTLTYATYASVNPNNDWLPVQQIAKSYENLKSIDDNYNGIVDIAESLNGFTDKDFLKVQGGILKGSLYLYYGLGKIVDMDNLNYFVDPSSSSRFYSLCLGDGCIKKWSELDNYISSSNNDLSLLTQWCVAGDCSNGLNAIKLEGHEIGNQEGNIPVISSSVTYRNLKVGYAEVSSKIGNLTEKDIQPLLNERCPDNQTIIGFDYGKVICAPLNLTNYAINTEVEEINFSLTKYLNKKIELINNNISYLNITLSEKDKRLTEEISFLRSDVNDLSNTFAKKEEIKALESSLNLQNNKIKNLDEKISKLLINKNCETGILKGFDASQNPQCIAYSYLSSLLMPSFENYFANKNELTNIKNSLNIHKNKIINIESKISSLIANKKCNTGVLTGFDSFNKPICKNYDSLSSALSFYMKEDLQPSLDLRYVKQTDLNVILSNYLKKSEVPRCNNGEFLSNKYGTLQCLQVPKPLIKLENTYYTYDYYSDKEGTFTLECPTGYVMTGIKIKREEEEGLSGGEKFVRKIDLICRKINVD